MEFKVCSSAFNQGGFLPEWYKADNLNSSPPLGWACQPEGTVSLAVVCKSNENRVHWVLWNIPGTVDTIYGKLPGERELPGGLRHGLNDFAEIGWTGPSRKDHELHLTVYMFALDCKLHKPETDFTAADLMRAMDGHIIGEATLTCDCS